MSAQKTPRDPEIVIDQIIAALGGYEHWPIACNDLTEIKSNHRFRAPELHYLTWEEIKEVLLRVIGTTDSSLVDTSSWNEQQKAAIRIFADNPNCV